MIVVYGPKGCVLIHVNRLCLYYKWLQSFRGEREADMWICHVLAGAVCTCAESRTWPWRMSWQNTSILLRFLCLYGEVWVQLFKHWIFYSHCPPKGFRFYMPYRTIKKLPVLKVLPVLIVQFMYTFLKIYLPNKNFNRPANVFLWLTLGPDMFMYEVKLCEEILKFLFILSFFFQLLKGKLFRQVWVRKFIFVCYPMSHSKH